MPQSDPKPSSLLLVPRDPGLLAVGPLGQRAPMMWDRWRKPHNEMWEDDEALEMCAQCGEAWPCPDAATIIHTWVPCGARPPGGQTMALALAAEGQPVASGISWLVDHAHQGRRGPRDSVVFGVRESLRHSKIPEGFQVALESLGRLVLTDSQGREL